MATRGVWFSVTTTFLVVALATASPALAKTDVLKHGAANLLQAPLDVALAPYTMTDSFVRRFYLSDKRSLAEKITLTPLMGAVYIPCCTAITIVAALFRGFDGVVNVPVGLALLGSDSDVDLSMYDEIHGKRGALVDKSPLYFGAYHCEGFFQ